MNFGEPSVSIRWPDTTAKTDSPSKAGKVVSWTPCRGLRRSRLRAHGPLGRVLQYFYKRLTDGAGRIGDAQDCGESWSNIHGGDFTEHSLRRHSWDEKDDRH